MPPKKFQPSANLLCVRCKMDRAAHKEGAPGSCSQFANVLPKRRGRFKPRRVPTTRERIWNATKGEK